LGRPQLPNDLFRRIPLPRHAQPPSSLRFVASKTAAVEGGRSISNYQWDASREPERILGPDCEDTLTPFTRLETLTNLFFTGCNVPLLTMGVPRKHKVPIQVPGKAVSKFPDAAKIKCDWTNYYDPDDVLGYGLTAEFESYFAGKHPKFKRGGGGRDPDKDCKVNDVEFEIRDIRALTPFAHVLYWRSGRVLDGVADSAKALMNR
ncbi:MAG: hypothetical protein PVI23_08235, partial [Maricaulaceae bacterium]